jgi:hypothetical protein
LWQGRHPGAERNPYRCCLRRTPQDRRPFMHAFTVPRHRQLAVVGPRAAAPSTVHQRFQCTVLSRNVTGRLYGVLLKRESSSAKSGRWIQVGP